MLFVEVPSGFWTAVDESCRPLPSCSAKAHHVFLECLIIGIFQIFKILEIDFLKIFQIYTYAFISPFIMVLFWLFSLLTFWTEQIPIFIFSDNSSHGSNNSEEIFISTWNNIVNQSIINGIILSSVSVVW